MFVSILNVKDFLAVGGSAKHQILVFLYLSVFVELDVFVKTLIINDIFDFL